MQNLVLAYCTTNSPKHLARLESSIRQQNWLRTKYGKTLGAGRAILVTDAEGSELPRTIRDYFKSDIIYCNPYKSDEFGEKHFCLSAFRNASISFALYSRADYLMICDCDTVIANNSDDLTVDFGVPNVYWQKSDRETIRAAYEVSTSGDREAFSKGNSWFILSKALMADMIFNENFYGYGYEDKEFYIRALSKGYKLHQTNMIVIHKYHPTEERVRHPGAHDRNRRLYEACEALFKLGVDVDPRWTMDVLRTTSSASVEGRILLVAGGLAINALDARKGSFSRKEDAISITWGAGLTEEYVLDGGRWCLRAEAHGRAPTAAINSSRIIINHPHWRGYVSLDHTSNRLCPEGKSACGTFEFEGGNLEIDWDHFGKEKFIETCVIYNKDGFNRPLDLKGSVTQDGLCYIDQIPVKAREISVENSDLAYPVILRVGTTDAQVYRQIFIQGQYRIGGIPPDTKTVVDAGANIGLASCYFASKFPSARIIAIEPDGENFKQLARNVSRYKNIEIIQAAVWGVVEPLSLATADAHGKDLGAWGRRAEPSAGRAQGRVEGMTMKSLMDGHKLRKVDLLKMDIEGAEMEVFSANDLSWLECIQTIVIETHDNVRAGCEARVKAALDDDFTELPPSGEHLVFVRKDAALTTSQHDAA